ncbi:uncharacterized protein LOC105190427 [Harpegnathos saltator]|uniref:uncharacterized protein LOC105190427 n=1 Tax=Harpegnathos saltator TaxID=610380 RepID=UPI00058D4A73|nr:uncharacterized protein LOC105190427 [Harpegnathos saltator]XP_011151489.1 uncharacterized protein LOC105190427 [Harpegnathos saltator]XP_011151490.1 uncharacterized protein LOC105190427 [Harpegnathos saltator]
MRWKESLLLILLSLAFASRGCDFGKRRMHTHRKSNGDGDRCTCAIPTIRYISSAESNRTVDPHCECDSSTFVVMRKIPYGGLENNGGGIIHVDLMSACIRCSMCSAVADEISETLFEIHDTMAPGDWLTDAQAVLLLRSICDQSFRHYGLREIDDERFISDPLPGDRLVTSSADGLWEKSLRSMCHEYLDEIQELQLYRKWMEWCEDDEHLSSLEDVLCRNEISSLRDCRGMGNVYKQYVPTKDYSAYVKVLAESHNCG